MPFNAYGDLYKSEVVLQLQARGCDVKNVHALNLILEEMGILEKVGRDWLTTDAGMKYTIYTLPVYNADAWHPCIVDDVYDYLNSR